jgi:hypothetical protein
MKTQEDTANFQDNHQGYRLKKSKPQKRTKNSVAKISTVNGTGKRFVLTKKSYYIRNNNFRNRENRDFIDLMISSITMLSSRQLNDSQSRIEIFFALIALNNKVEISPAHSVKSLNHEQDGLKTNPLSDLLSVVNETFFIYSQKFDFSSFWEVKLKVATQEYIHESQSHKALANEIKSISLELAEEITLKKG